MSHLTLALDIGGTKIAAGLVDADGTLLTSTQEPTPRGDDPEAVWTVTEHLIAATTAGHDVGGAGIACAGPVHLPTGTVSPINLTAWREFPIRDRVAGVLPGLPVRLGGDGVCMALGEHWRGAGQGAAFVDGLDAFAKDAASFSTVPRTSGAPAMPAMSGTSSSTPRGRSAPVVAAAAPRPSPAGRTWCSGRAKTVGMQRRRPPPRSWPPRPPLATRWRCGRSGGARRRWRP